MRQSHYDPFNATGISNLSNTLSLNGTDETNEGNVNKSMNLNTILEDENLRKVLDSIDIKIG